jgi:hypothetical protein
MPDLLPRFLSREDAARYLGVCVDSFDAEVRAGMWPAGVARGAKGGRLMWDKAALDATVDRISGLANALPDNPRDAWDARTDGRTAPPPRLKRRA